MSAFYIILTTALYFLLLFAVSRKAGGAGDNDTFFRGNRRSPWWAVAFGMIGASLSGVSFVSVPGMVRDVDMTYMQMCVGFFFGYLVVAFVLLPLYYKLNLTSIYTYLDVRFGKTAYRTGASFFLLSKMLGAAARLYLVCLILQNYVFGSMGVPFEITAAGTVFLIWLYTFRGGIKSLVWTDALQTLCLITALVLILYQLCRLNDFTVTEAIRYVTESPYGRWIEWDDWTSRQHFAKQFFSGVFIVIVMTGLDQDMMQKNLTCKNLRDAQKDMCSYGLSFIRGHSLAREGRRHSALVLCRRLFREWSVGVVYYRYYRGGVQQCGFRTDGLDHQFLCGHSGRGAEVCPSGGGKKEGTRSDSFALCRLYPVF